MYFVVDVKSLLLHRVNSYSTQLINIPNEIFIEKVFSFIVRLLYFVGIRSVLKSKYERLFFACSVHHIPVLFNDWKISQCLETMSHMVFS